MKRSSFYALLGGALTIACLMLLRHFGVGMKDTVKFVLYEAFFVALPGMAIYASIQSKPTWNEKFIFIGWALGYALHTLFYMLCAALDARSYQWLFPVLSLLLFVFAHYGVNKNKFSIPKLSISGAFIKNYAFLMGCLLIFLGLMAIVFYKELPLFEQALKGSDNDFWPYAQDYFFQLGTINEALLHFPITDPRIANEPLPYYNFFYFHSAAVCDMTGLETSVFYFRLYFIPIAIVIMGLIKSLSSRINKGSVAWLAAIIPFFLSEASMDPSAISLFLHVPIIQLAISPTLTMGLLMYLASLCAIYQLVDNWKQATTIQKFSLMSVVLFFVFICGLTKGVALVNIIGGQLIWVFMDIAILRKKPQIPLLLPLLSLAIFAYFTYTYRELGQRFVITPLTTIQRQPAFGPLFTEDMPAYLKTLLEAALVPFSLIGIFGVQLIGLIGWKLSKPLKELAATPEIGLLYQLAASTLCLFTFNNRTFDQVTFLVLGIPAAAPLMVNGLVFLFKKMRSAQLLPKIALGVVCAALVIFQAGNVPFAYRDRLKSNYFPGLSFGIYSNKLATGFMRGLFWLRSHSSPDEVVATNDPFGPTHWPASMSISAVAQRRAFLEGWIYSAGSFRYTEVAIMTRQVIPYEERLALNTRVFEEADPDALNILRDKYGVRYLVIDKVRMGKTKFLNKIADSVYSNYAIEIYKVRN